MAPRVPWGTPRDPSDQRPSGLWIGSINHHYFGIYYQYIINEWPPHHQWLLGPGCQLIFELRDLYLQRHQSRILLLAQLILNQNTGRSQGHSVWLNHPDSTTLVDASTASTPNYIAVCYGAGVYQFMGSSLPGSTAQLPGNGFLAISAVRPLRTMSSAPQSVWVIPGKHPRASKHDNILQCKSM